MALRGLAKVARLAKKEAGSKHWPQGQRIPENTGHSTSKMKAQGASPNAFLLCSPVAMFPGAQGETPEAPHSPGTRYL